MYLGHFVESAFNQDKIINTVEVLPLVLIHMYPLYQTQMQNSKLIIIQTSLN